MRLTFLGTSHGRTEKNAFCSSTMISVGEKHYLIDAGAPITTLLQNVGVPFPSVAGIFITHSHGDHIAGLVEYTREMECFPANAGVRTNVYVPEEKTYLRMSYFLFGKEELHQHRVIFHTYAAGVVFDDGVLRLTAIPNNHMPNSYSFLVEAEGKRVIFTGDLAAGMPDYPKVALEAPSDVVICEAAHTRLNKPETEKILQQTKTARFVVHHRSPKCNPDEAIDAFTRDMAPHFPVLLAHDGMILDV